MADTKRKTKNITLGRGELWFKKSGESTYRPIGNTPAFGLSVTSETLKHYDSGQGVRVQDAEVVVQTDYAGSFTTDNVNHENIAMMLLGTSSTVAVSGSTGESETFTSAKQGDRIKLAAANVTNVVVKVGATTHDLTDDYTLDAARGQVTIVNGGAIADGDDVIVEYDITAHSYDRTVSAGNAIEGALLFVANNPEGDNTDYEIADAKLSPNGEFQIKADEWQALPFNIAIGTPDAGSAITANGQPYTP